MNDDEIKVEEEEVKVIEPSEGIDDLKKKLEDERKFREEERRARMEAEAERNRAIQEQYVAQNRAEESDLQIVVSGINTVRGNIERIEKDYADALSVGDFQQAAKLQTALSMQTSQLSQLEQGKSYLESRPKKEPPPPPAPADPVEAFAARLSARSADWVRAHPECVRDSRMQQKMIAAHQLAVADGVEPDTDEYFARVEETIGLNKPPARRAAEVEHDEEDALSSAATEVKRRAPAAPPAAPVSRSGGPGSPRGGNTIRLTPQQRETAQELGMTEEDYARNIALLKQEGRMS